LWVTAAAREDSGPREQHRADANVGDNRPASAALSGDRRGPCAADIE
jgi:hypothetical protein